ncbi:MAG: 2Fe-2S iron-sulfur cluster-binding protein [Trueperaceae bacterium]|nr:2Fe-2S iron-sulfur cluster-binding protein [Trueperaceae bacterium]
MTELRVNGRPVQVDAPDDEPLLWVLRDDLALPGTRYGCGAGICGSCTVMLDGAPVRSCQTPLSVVAGREVRTVDAPPEPGSVAAHVRAALLEHQVPQCGWCMSGWQMQVTAALESDPGVDDASLIAGLDANLCRCGTYARLRRAVRDAAARVRSDAEGA